MSQLGLPASGTTAPSSGWFNDASGNSQFMSGAYTMPAGGGIVSDLFVYCAGDGATAPGQLVIWNWASGTIAWQSGAITLSAGSHAIGGQAWQHASVPNIYLPAGTYGFGFWSSGNVVWTYESSGTVTYQRSVASAPATFVGAGTEGSGALGAYITYTPGGVAYVNTGTPAAPVWTQGTAYVNTGTPASPVWTPCAGLYVNTGTPASPIWTPGA